MGKYGPGKTPYLDTSRSDHKCGCTNLLKRGSFKKTFEKSRLVVLQQFIFFILDDEELDIEKRNQSQKESTNQQKKVDKTDKSSHEKNTVKLKDFDFDFVLDPF